MTDASPHAAEAASAALPRRLFIANRGEIAVRIARACAELGVESVAARSEDEPHAAHLRVADRVQSLGAAGVRAWLDPARVTAAAVAAGCDALHPGYGFLSEDAGFARACAEAGLTFVGPSPETLALFGDEAAARALARREGAPLPAGGAATLEEARAFLAALGPGGAVMVKAVAGGGGRGMRPAETPEELAQAWEVCAREALAAFGRADLYVERLVRRARHVEVQVLGDGRNVQHLWERDCTLQRRRQKLVEIAPAPELHPVTRDGLLDAALRLARASGLRALATFEFLVDRDAEDPAAAFHFIEANPRLQVEHTVTEEVTGVDLVKAQIRLACGATLADLGLAEPPPPPRGHAVQLRLNAEVMDASGGLRPAAGRITAWEPPSGPGVRVDAGVGQGAHVTGAYDTLVAKLICADPSTRFADVVARSYRALCEFRVEGVATNAGLLANLLKRPEFADYAFDTGFVETHVAALVHDAPHPRRHADADPAAPAPAAAARAEAEAPEGCLPLRAPLRGTVVAIGAEAGAEVAAGAPVLTLEAMKMEHAAAAPEGAQVVEILVAPGETVEEGQPLAFLRPTGAGGAAAEDAAVDLDALRPDLAAAMARRRLTLDEARPEAVARRRRSGQRTARENVADLVDPGSFTEFGGLTVAAQRTRRSLEDLIARTPADGLVTGAGTVNGALFGTERARAGVMAYDFTVLAGTQGWKNHAKTDRLLDLCHRRRLPLVLFSEGGGGRPGDTDFINSGGLDTPTFHRFAGLSGMVPLVGINSGKCFAGNAVLLGCCDVIIATADSNIGMGGPAMIEGGGLGVYRPEEVGPMSVQVPNGVVDIAVADEAEAVATAKKYLAYFQGAIADWRCADQRLLRHVVPENRRRAYDMRRVVELVADEDSVLELRRGWGAGAITALARVEGRPLGIVANNPLHLGGAIDADAAAKAARFMKLCDAFDLPLLMLCDTPGNMVGPEAEATALVRHCSRMFLVGANLKVPAMTVVTRKGYGLGAQGMAAGGFKNTRFTVAWPTGEFGGMGLEGFVRLGFRDRLEAIADPEAREAEYRRLVAEQYDKGAALSAASLFDIDDVIDPAETRRWIVGALDRDPTPPREGKRHAWIDAW